MSATSSDGRDTCRASGGRLSALFELARNMIERAHDLPDGLGGDAGVERRGVELGVPQQDLDHPDIGVLLQKMRRKAVTKGVRGHLLADLAHRGCAIAGGPELARRHRVDRVHSGKQPPLWACRVVPGAQQLKQMRRKHHVAVLVALALFDPDHHALAVDVGYLQRDHLGHAQSGPIGHAQCHLVSPGAASRKRATSSGLRTTGSLRGTWINWVWFTMWARPSVILKKNRSVETLWLRVGTPAPLVAR